MNNILNSYKSFGFEIWISGAFFSLVQGISKIEDKKGEKTEEKISQSTKLFSQSGSMQESQREEEGWSNRPNALISFDSLKKRER